jgi:hypothetical protein
MQQRFLFLLATRAFSTFSCDAIDGVQHRLFLVADYSVDCESDSHFIYMGVAVLFIIVYIIGVPLFILISLFKNRKHLHDETSVLHDDVHYTLGALYEQYEQKFWWFELVVIIHKMIMT